MKELRTGENILEEDSSSGYICVNGVNSTDENETFNGMSLFAVSIHIHISQHELGLVLKVKYDVPYIGLDGLCDSHRGRMRM